MAQTAARQADDRILLTVEEAAARLKIGRTHAWSMAKTGSLPTVRLGKCVRVPVAALMRMYSGVDHAQGRRGL